MNKSNIRIVSDGSPQGTMVYGAEGKPLTGVKSVSWACAGASCPAIATIEFINVEIDVIGESENE